MIKYRFLVIILLFVIVFQSYAVSPESIYASALEKYDKKQFKEAVDILLLFIEDYPDNNWADASVYLLGDCYINLNKPDIARKYFLKLIHDYVYSPLIPDSHYFIGKTYEIEKKYSLMIDKYRFFIINFPESYWVHDANTALTKYASHEESDAETVLYNIAIEYLKKGLVDKAREYFLRIIERYPDTENGYNSIFQLGELEFNNMIYNKAAEYYKKIPFDHNFFIKSQSRLGQIEFYKKNYENAVVIYQNILDKKELSKTEEYILSYYMISECYLILEKKELAKKILKEFVSKYKTSEYYERAFETLNNLEENNIVRKIKVNINQEENIPAVDKLKLKEISRLNRQLTEQKVSKKNIKTLREKLLSYKENIILVEKNMEKKNYYDAISNYEDLVSIDKNKSEIYYKLALLYNQMKDSENAIRCLDLYIKNGGEEKDVYSLYAYLYYKLNRLKDSVEFYKKSYKEEKNNKFKEDSRLAIQRLEFVIH